MIGTTVLRYTHVLLPPEDPPESSEIVSLRVKEQECLTLLKKCNTMEEFNQAHAHFLKLGFFTDSFCASNLVATCALSRWGSMDYACSIFRQIDQPCSFDFNTMIKGYASDMSMENALLLYCEMLEEGVRSDNYTYPALFKACSWLRSIEEGKQIHGHIVKLGLESDLYVQNTLINMYGKCGMIEHSCSVFHQIEHKDAASWSSIITAHTSLSLWGDCLGLFEEMIDEGSCRPEESVLASVLSACSHLGALDFGKCLHGLLLRNLKELNLTVETALIDMYIKCGCIERGFHIFKRMTKKNHFSYSVMISGLATNGCSTEALQVFSEMLAEGLQPDDAIYVGVMSACSQGGFVKEGLRHFNRMKSEHGIQPTVKHYGCMVDLMGRAGMLTEALEFIKSMHVEPNDVIWRSLLKSCKVHDNLSIGEIAAKSLLGLNSHNPSDLLMLSNMYARARRWDEAAMIRTEIVRKGLIQTPGYSLVECDRKVHKFVSQDKSHPQHKEIYEMIHQMEWQLKFEGYSPDTSHVLLDVDDEEKRDRLKGHSQKLALAFALINTSEESAIRITRNVRMCSDCHSYTKFISHIYSREIIVRDRNMFHHFKNGNCSCKDYW